MTTTVKAISTEYAPLTKDQVKAIRQADSVTVFHNPFCNDNQTQAGLIRLTKEIKPEKGWNSDRTMEVSTEIPVWSNVSYLANWGAENANVTDSATKETHKAGVTTISTYSGTFKTFAHFIKAGDTLELVWDFDIYGKGSPMRLAGFTVDVLKIKIRRDNAEYKFLLEIYAGPVDSLVRFACRHLWG